MFLVGLTGGIGSGKSAVAERLEAFGAVIVDADRIVRDLQAPGQPVLAAMVELLGPQILLADGSLDRAAVAEVVFHDRSQLEALNAIVHPAVRDEIFQRLADLADTDEVVVLDIPLLTEGGWSGMGAVIVVDVDPELAVARLVEHRSFTEADARARIANQASREERLATATWVVTNSGTLADLDRRVTELWDEIGAARTAE